MGKRAANGPRMAAAPGMMARWMRNSLAIAALAVLAWFAGFVWFLRAIDASPTELPEKADAIVVLTGGAGRVETALRLLAQNRADRLLISGVGRTEFAELARRAGVDPALAPRVTLGRLATSTRGNAVETADWLRGNSVQTIIIVTATYHMPRALRELAAAVPNIRLIAFPVLPSYDSETARLRLLLGEYTKLIAVELGLSRFGAHEESAR
jgi:uncharacterized SAM-binding protein YcdF (DUF218 family)